MEIHKRDTNDIEENKMVEEQKLQKRAKKAIEEDDGFMKVTR
jgi:hypothetical protein